MGRYLKVKQVLACQAQPTGSKYPFRIKVLEKSQTKIDDQQSLETTQVVSVNSLVEVPKGPQLVACVGGIVTERAGREIKSVVEWERIEVVVPSGTTSDKIMQILLNPGVQAGQKMKGE